MRGHFILSGQMNEPNFAFKMRQNPVFLCICAGYRKIKIQAVAKLICQVLPKCTGDDRR
jgi:hypothetical protein